MEIEKASQRQLLEVIYIIREGAQQLMDKGVKHWHNTHIDYSQIEKDLDKGYVYILSKNMGPIGTVTLKPDPEAEGTLLIDRLSVYHAFQGKGLAKMLLEFALDIAKKQNYSKIKVTIPMDDQSLRNLFEKKGFDNTDTIRQVPPELIKFVFEKDLK